MPSDSPLQSPATLVVDLDGTLIATDTLWESALLLCRRHPLVAVQMPFWLAGGKTNPKRRIADYVTPDPAMLPYNADVIDFLRQQKNTGRKHSGSRPLLALLEPSLHTF